MTRVSKFVLLGLTRDQYERTRREAKQLGIGVNQLIRIALEKYLLGNELKRIDSRKHLATIDLNEPLVIWTREEEEFAHKVIKHHFDEDR